MYVWESEWPVEDVYEKVLDLSYTVISGARAVK